MMLPKQHPIRRAVDRIVKIFDKFNERDRKRLASEAMWYVPELNDLACTNGEFWAEAATVLANRRRTPKRFADRDAEIVRLSAEFSDGEICDEIKDRWPENQNGQPITPAMVGAARRRLAKKGTI